MENIFIQLGALLGITVSIAFLMRVLRQPLMVAYIIAGIVAGPLFLDIVHGDAETLNAFAEFGVILLLFLVGLSLNVNHIRRIGKVAVITGVGQVLFTAFFGFFLMRWLQFSLSSAFFVAVAITFSSTIIIVKLLNDKKDTESTYGRYTLGLMVVQDIIAVAVMLVITSMNDGGGTLIDSISVLLFKGVVLLSLVYFLSRFVLYKLLDFVARSSEFLFIFTIAWLFGVAGLLYWAGFGLEIGAIIAGISLGSSPYASQIGSRIKPMRDFFIVLFFIILGSEMQLAGLNESIVPAVMLSLFILLGNPFILYFLFRFQKFSRRNSFLAGVTAAQVSEFGFILLFTGQQQGHLSGSELPIFTLVALITIFVSSYVITYNEQIYRFFLPLFHLFGPDQHVQAEAIEEEYDAFIFGYHRIGWKVAEALEKKNMKFAVIDFNPAAISKLKHRGIPAFYGDAADVEFLNALPLEKAKLIISTLPEADDQLVLIEHVRALSKRTHIIANLYHSSHLKELYKAGADYIMMPHLLGGNWISHVITDEPWTKTTYKRLRTDQRKEMKQRFSMGVDMH